ncbi:MAG: polysaccharide lyase [Frankiaceae bacterium]
MVAALVPLIVIGCSMSQSPRHSPTPTPEPTSVQAFFGAELIPESRGAFGRKRMAIHPSPDLPGPLLTVDYPAGSSSNAARREDGTPPGGAQVYLRMSSGPVDTLHLRYYVRFPAGFDFVRGGKLPGLYGGDGASGGQVPDGTDGFSTRYMWRAGGLGEVYAYLPTSKHYGTSLGRGAWTWRTGRWTCIEQAVVLNTPGRDDGQITVWVDGDQVLHEDGLLFRTVPDLRIEGVFFSTFFGGNDETWSTPRDQKVQFAAFASSPYYIGPLSPPPEASHPTQVPGPAGGSVSPTPSPSG